jgi:hypothetical protein
VTKNAEQRNPLIECVQLAKSLVREAPRRDRRFAQTIGVHDRGCIRGAASPGAADKTASSSDSIKVRLEWVPLLPARNPSRSAPVGRPDGGKNIGPWASDDNVKAATMSVAKVSSDIAAVNCNR